MPINIDFTDQDRAIGEAFLRLASAADEFEGYAHPHASRIAKLSDALARTFQLAQHDRSALRLAALAHDLGETAMDRSYINRAGPLTQEERLDLARHPVIGEQEAARAGGDRAVQLLVRWHHEWWDGSGYPDRLRREQIPFTARILRVADAYASLTDARPHRAAMTEDEAKDHLKKWAGLEFDPHVVRALLSLKHVVELDSYAKTGEPTEIPETQPDRSEPELVSEPATLET